MFHALSPPTIPCTPQAGGGHTTWESGNANPCLPPPPPCPPLPFIPDPALRCQLACPLQPAYDQSKGYLHTVYDKVTGKAQDASQQAQEQAYDRAAGTAQAGQKQAGQARGR